VLSPDCRAALQNFHCFIITHTAGHSHSDTGRELINFPCSRYSATKRYLDQKRFGKNKFYERLQLNGSNLIEGYVKSLDDPAIKAMVLDVLKPHSPPLYIFAKFLAELDGLDEVDVSLVEMDERTESLKVVISGPSIDYEVLREHMGKQGAVIHSVDQVIVENEGS
jgi:hypothetical protein